MWNKAFVYGWVAILAILVGYELYAVLRGGQTDPPLTWVTVKYVPKWITLPFLGWLFTHFLTRYLNPDYIKSLDLK